MEKSEPAAIQSGQETSNRRPLYLIKRQPA